ncbi:ABC transporter ATP-binding protein/permease [Streptomyces kunmingensis]|uniref:ABC transporter ATP-binding protein/permease n=1 Tax=Streptomyces kunmingensis TaxID=68225 RepID=A0ABU6C4S1_9ACTN|nr:ABC transporter ATP-binding protein [Streptomyces kunmingensis]MEB3959729.1 ABC transporter ATP-binding protein/permease [Streptomyces kunmingensis]
MKTSGDTLLRTATRYSAGRCLALCLLTVASAGTGLLLPYVLGRTVDALLAAHSAGGGDPAGGDAAHWLVLCAALLGGLTLLDCCESVLTGATSARTTAWLRRRLVRHVLAVGPGATARFPAGDLVARLVGGTAQAGPAPATVAALAATLVLPVGAIAALALTDLWLAAAFLAGAPALALLLRAFARASSDCVAAYLRAQGSIATRLTEAIGGARTIAAARTADREAARVLEPLPELSHQGLRLWRVQGRASAGAVALAPLLQIAVIATAGLLLLHHRLSVGELLAASRYAVLATGVGVLVGDLAALVRTRAAAQRLGEVLDEPAPQHGDAQLAPGGGRLELRGVTARRDGRTVLDHIDLTVPAGETLAVVGASGAGKSLLAALAGRLADPDEGTVLLDGTPLPELGRTELRAAIGYAFERPALLGDTLADTIALGPDPRTPDADRGALGPDPRTPDADRVALGPDPRTPDADRVALGPDPRTPDADRVALGPDPRPPHGDRVLRAAEAAHADGFVRRLPDGYATACADAPLSGGEVQRLGLARAFAHGGRLLVLDDALSSLDMITEREIAAALLRHAPGTTRLVVAHRATTAARASTVAWLDAGRLRALGPHARLWNDPAYRAVFAGDGASRTDEAAGAAGADRDSEADGADGATGAGGAA